MAFRVVGMPAKHAKPRAKELCYDLGRLHGSNRGAGSVLESRGGNETVHDDDLMSAPSLIEHLVVLQAGSPSVVLGSCARPADVTLSMQTTAAFPRLAKHRRNRVDVPDYLERFLFFEAARLATTERRPRAGRFVVTQGDGQALYCSFLVFDVPSDPGVLVAHAARQMRQGSGGGPAGIAAARNLGLAGSSQQETSTTGTHFSVPLWLR